MKKLKDYIVYVPVIDFNNLFCVKAYTGKEAKEKVYKEYFSFKQPGYIYKKDLQVITLEKLYKQFDGEAICLDGLV